ncbi:hypothetical protein SAMN02745165_01898 [Malonomonas rubra DSM 5091]|uniref:Uncharacterized protein n=1 Tax=Malonomonas rubra DSM 5091 TaxID=1122189 RepID=A0A1M6HNE7_MALRU|nr:hypothetical protein [Malonomonas rubra]SHJ23727.1 hypothetical protein SAMN02745165_01898 [Malonomonas rubra DSM 5091]
MAINNLDELRDFYHVWFEYLIRTPAFGVALFEEECLEHNRKLPGKWTDPDGFTWDPYTPENILFLRRYEEWWNRWKLEGWTFELFWNDHWQKLERLYFGVETERSARKCRFLLPAPGTRWGEKMSDSYKKKLNHFVMSRQFSIGQVIRGGMWQSYCGASIIEKGVVVAYDHSSWKGIDLPFEASVKKSWQDYYAKAELRPSNNEFPWSIDNRVPYREMRDCDEERQRLNSDIRFVKEIFNNVENGWFPRAPKKTI